MVKTIKEQRRMNLFRKSLLGGEVHSKRIDGWEVSWESNGDYRHWCIQRRQPDAPLILVVMLNPGKLSGDGRELASDSTLRVLRNVFAGTVFNHIVINLFDLAASKKESLLAQWSRRDPPELVFHKLTSINFSGIIFAYGDIEKREIVGPVATNRIKKVKFIFERHPIIRTPLNKSGCPAHPLNWQRRSLIPEVLKELLNLSK